MSASRRRISIVAADGDVGAHAGREKPIALDATEIWPPPPH